MAEPPTEPSGDSTDEVLAEYFQRVNRGERVNRGQFIAEHPEVAAGLRAYFANSDAMRAVLGAPAVDETATFTGGRAGQAEETPPHGSGRATEGSARILAPIPSEPAVLDAVAVAPGRSLGRYRIERLLGGGSFGRVYLAWDNDLQRRVAIKVPHDRLFASAGDFDRFLDEARTVAQLEHPGIAAVYDVGTTPEGAGYLVTRWIDGPTLKAWLDGHRPTPAEAAELVARVAEAVHHAHRKGFVHRDLKPGNILLDAAGRPHVVDFGLALHESRQRSRAGESAGSPAYMAPEQVRGEAHRLDGRTDIWALGVILYQMLAHRRPFDGPTRKHLEDEILHRDPKPPRQLDDQVPAELERVCLRCLAKDVTQRYATAGDLAADLRRWLRPRRRVGPWAAVAALAAFAVLAVVVPQMSREPPLDGASSPPPAVPAVVEAPLDGTLDVWVWAADDAARRRVTIHQPGVLPLRPGDQIRIEVLLSRPAYLYLVLVTSRGLAMPIYPWSPGDWAGIPEEEAPTDRLSLPAEVDEGWRVTEPYGTETLLLLARDEPLPPELDFRELLAGLPPQHSSVTGQAIWFVDGQPLTKTGDVLRGIALHETAGIDDSLLRTQRLIHERLGEHFPMRHAVSFASAAADEEND